jgi:hypothetical protein
MPDDKDKSEPYEKTEGSKMFKKEETTEEKKEREGAFSRWHKSHGKPGEPKGKTFAERVAAREPVENKRYEKDHGKIEGKHRVRTFIKEERERATKRAVEKRERLEPKRQLEAAKAHLREKKEEIRAEKLKAREHTLLARTERAFDKSGQNVKDMAQYLIENRGERPKGKIPKGRTNKARQFAKAQQPNQPYRQTLSDPYDLNPRRDYEFFGQPREYNLIGENKKYDLGFGSGKKHDLGVGKKYDLGVGGKKVDLFGNGNGKKKKNDKFW